MKFSIIIFCGLVSLVSSHVLPTEPREKCSDVGPEEYCASATQAEECGKTEFCEKYLRQHICDRGPAAYCKTLASALTCGKEAYCLTWPDDSVVAERIKPRPSPWDRINYAAASAVGGAG